MGDGGIFIPMAGTLILNIVMLVVMLLDYNLQVIENQRAHMRLFVIPLIELERAARPFLIF
ncbi:hypothetical protein BADSM9389_35950 [Buttiauxella agrestis]|nr:hypothetical protein BADSM9389_35950 [Buttiauxella agrestis]